MRYHFLNELDIRGLDRVGGPGSQVAPGFRCGFSPCPTRPRRCRHGGRADAVVARSARRRRWWCHVHEWIPPKDSVDTLDAVADEGSR
jgi:hypothetical protein